MYRTEAFRCIRRYRCSGFARLSAVVLHRLLFEALLTACLPRYLTNDTGLQARGKVQHHELNIFVPASVFDLPTKCSYVTHLFQLCPIKAVQHLGNRQPQVAFRS